MIFINTWNHVSVATVKDKQTMIMAALPKFSYKEREYTFVDTQLQTLEDLRCPTCKKLVCDPVQTSCGHVFCEKCMEGTRTCPIEGEVCTTTPDNYNKRRLWSFKVKCSNAEKGCEWQGQLGEAEGHTQEACKFEEVKCPRGCNEIMPRKDLPEHLLKYCPLRDDECPYYHHQDTNVR